MLTRLGSLPWCVCSDWVSFSFRIYSSSLSYQLSVRVRIKSVVWYLICVLIYRVTQKTVITKNRITSKILFRLTQNFSYIRSSLCSRHLQSYKSVLQKLFVSLALKKVCSKRAPRRCTHIWIRRAKFSMTLPHSSLGIALIAAFRSGIVWGLLPYTLSLRYPHI